MTSLTIIIPHYNSTDTVLKLLDSVPVKKEIQILIIDDHSNQEEKQKLMKFKDNSTHRDIQFLENDSGKKGAGSSRNVGLKNAIGEWILFADSDDFFVDGFYDSIEKYFNANVDVVFFKPTSIELETGNISNRHTRFAEIIDDYSETNSRKSELMLRYRVVVPWSKLIKKSVIEENEILFENVISSNDVMFSANLGHHIKTFDISKDTIYCVTKSSGSLTTSMNSEVFDTRIDVFVRYYKFLQEHLSKEDFNSLDLSGQGIVFLSTKHGFKKFYNVIRVFRKNNIRIFHRNMFSPVKFFKRVALIQSHRKNTKRLN
ncbi:Glycosyltransferase involved in cell wall bisynthesis [Virgibacillus subterraneus]|uniref:Glycosyltransferase involved in cell wall bisynthesis n=1 Tax=Virgibacillus subterraneus TaxID=621109 RepID=A0A1H9EDV7_9BACI|nr:glycosyltransferase family 2 protein [Virgibacillus subterraneus]SEQ23900.1 Glycosyltransferase involved in cell wall bisynthesis [Virgibacillus subterraneus]